MIMPTAMATSPAGMPPGYLNPPNQLTRMMAKQVRPMTGVMYICMAGCIAMNVTETPASVPSSAARGDLADDRRDESADHQDEALKEHPDQAGFPSLDRVVGLQGDRQHDHERD